MTYHLSRRLSALESSLSQPAHRTVRYVWIDDPADTGACEAVLARARQEDPHAEVVILRWQDEDPADATRQEAAP